jgi:hypothetical protein
VLSWLPPDALVSTKKPRLLLTVFLAFGWNLCLYGNALIVPVCGTAALTGNRPAILAMLERGLFQWDENFPGEPLKH